MKFLLIIGVAVALGGCAAAKQQAAVAKISTARAECTSKHQGRYVETAICMTNAENAIVRPVYPYADLLNATQAHRLMIAEKTDKRELTEAEANFQLTQFTAQMGSEASRRQQGQQAVAAAQSQAWSNLAIAGAAMARPVPTPTYVVQAPAIPRPVTCRSFGNTTTCQ